MIKKEPEFRDSFSKEVLPILKSISNDFGYKDQAIDIVRELIDSTEMLEKKEKDGS